MNLPKVVFTDIDGVWTDGGMYYDQSGNELKKFNTRDSAGLLFLRQLDIPVVVLTGEDTQIMRNRAEKLKLEHVYHGVKDKVAVAKSFCDGRGILLSEAAFIGDDLLDLPLLKRVGFSACPADAASYTQSIVEYISAVSGGEGAFRDFVEEIIRRSGVYQSTIDHWLNK
jgi:YrbI family 3-deoxy-D-manno-octulosonate 8-phosphate phosphatase